MRRRSSDALISVLDRERRRVGPIQDGEGRRADLDLAGRKVAIHARPLALDDRARHVEDELVAKLLGLLEEIGRRHEPGVEHDLGDPGAVAQVDEDELAVVPAAVHPSLEANGLADIGLAKRSGGGAGEDGHRRGSYRRARRAAARPTRASDSCVRRARSLTITMSPSALLLPQENGQGGSRLLRHPQAVPRPFRGRDEVDGNALLTERPGDRHRLLDVGALQRNQDDAARPFERLLAEVRRKDVDQAVLSYRESDARRLRAPEVGDELVVTPSAEDRVLRPEAAGRHLEDRARVVIETTDQKRIFFERNSGGVEIRDELAVMRVRGGIESRERSSIRGNCRDEISFWTAGSFESRTRSGFSARRRRSSSPRACSFSFEEKNSLTA